MFLNFIDCDGTIVNLNSIICVEDQTETEDNPIALITTLLGAEITLEGEAARRLYDQLEVILQVNQAAVGQAMQQVAATS